jgi:ATP-dependent DNA helicase RecG
MKFNLDLEDLRRRESERIEWKANVANIENVLETITAFSNDFSNLGGGYVICGAEEVEDHAGFQSVKFIGLTSMPLT